MAYTKHGHHISGTVETTPGPTSRARCGGPGMCGQCSREASLYTDNYGTTKDFEGEVLPGDNEANYQTKAMAAVKKVVDELYSLEESVNPPAYSLYVVWFAKIETVWKALVSTTLEDGMYYEVKYIYDKRQTTVTAFKKRKTYIIKD